MTRPSETSESPVELETVGDTLVDLLNEKVIREDDQGIEYEGSRVGPDARAVSLAILHLTNSTINRRPPRPVPPEQSPSQSQSQPPPGRPRRGPASG